MNLAELIENVNDLGYQGLDDQATNALNRTYRRVLGLRRWDFLEVQTTDAIVAGDTTIGLPADFKRVDAIELVDASGNAVSFEFRPYQQFREVAKWDSEQGVPQWWTERGGTIYFWPAADGAYTATIDYIKEAPAAMSGSSDEPIVPESYHDILVYGAAAELAARERDWSAYSAFSAIPTQRLAEMVAEHGVRQRQNARHVRRSKFWSSIRSYG